jgi:hypothetical protein
LHERLEFEEAIKQERGLLLHSRAEEAAAVFPAAVIESRLTACYFSSSL